MIKILERGRTCRLPLGFTSAIKMIKARALRRKVRANPYIWKIRAIMLIIPRFKLLLSFLKLK
jgi:hypothetical protein